jgi:hypothetical protein
MRTTSLAAIVLISGLALTGCAQSTPPDIFVSSEPEPSSVHFSSPLPGKEMDKTTAAAIAAGSSVIGMSLEKGGQKLLSQKYLVRIVSVDGEQSIVTADYVNTRINLTVVNNKIVGAAVG